MKDQKIGNPYKLIRSTTVCGAIIPSSQKYSKYDTELWHMQFGHVSEDGFLHLPLSIEFRKREEANIENKVVELKLHKESQAANQNKSHTEVHSLCDQPVGCKEGQKYKAHLVAEGYSQKEDIDYNEIFSLRVKHTSIRLLLALVRAYDMEFEHLRISFLHVYLEETIYMQREEGFVEPSKEGWVCKLKRSLYGLKQSPRQWYKGFDGFTVTHGYFNCEYDPCVYYSFCDDGSTLLLSLYVDDMLIAAKEKKHIAKLKKILSKEFDMKDLDAAKKILRMEIRKDRKSEEAVVDTEKIC
ncbi:Retrovirus-related Pol polyprotein from transposon TNT 1-94-like protein [Drosera capensis]